MTDAEVTVIGGGVVGLAIAAELAPLYNPTILLERHHGYGEETSGRNSEVIHAGIYYPHGSLKARLCVEGKRMLYSLCVDHDIPFRKITKLITASRDDQLQELERLYDHGLENDVELGQLTAEQVRRIEPAISSVGAILSPSTGIISAHGLMDYFARKAESAGGTLQKQCEVAGIDHRGDHFVITILESGGSSTFTTRLLINSAGLEADTVAALCGIDIREAGYELHWAKGSYFAVHGPKRQIVSRLIYPIPPRESLGIHAVIDLGERLRFGPDVEYLSERVIDYRVDETKRKEFGESVRAIVPEISDAELDPDFSGIRAKLQAKGKEPKDFVIREESIRGLPGLINLIGIDSPGLTASPAIAKYVREMIETV